MRIQYLWRSNCTSRDDDFVASKVLQGPSEPPDLDAFGPGAFHDHFGRDRKRQHVDPLVHWLHKLSEVAEPETVSEGHRRLVPEPLVLVLRSVDVADGYPEGAQRVGDDFSNLKKNIFIINQGCDVSPGVSARTRRTTPYCISYRFGDTKFANLQSGIISLYWDEPKNQAYLDR